MANNFRQIRSQYVAGHYNTPIIPKRFIEANSIHVVDIAYTKDYEYLTGFELLFDSDNNITCEAVMVMELLWQFGECMRNSDKTRDGFGQDIQRSKEYGIMLLLEDYVPPGSRKRVWEYYYRKSLERDINNRLWVL